MGDVRPGDTVGEHILEDGIGCSIFGEVRRAHHCVLKTIAAVKAPPLAWGQAVATPPSQMNANWMSRCCPSVRVMGGGPVVRGNAE